MQDEIDNAKVYAVCGVRSDAKFGSTEKYRDAFRLQGSNVSIANPLPYVNPQTGAAPFDALSTRQDKQNMKTGAKFNTEGYNGKQYGLFGRGDADYLIEPQALCTGESYLKKFDMPAYEVNVTVVVEHNGQQLVYTRTYLPEYKFMDAAKVPAVPLIDPYKERPANYVMDIYQQQMNHIADIRNYLRNTLQFSQSTLMNYFSYGIFMKYDKANEAGAYLFDGDPNTKWCTTKSCLETPYSYDGTASRMDLATGKKRVWAAEFSTNIGICPSRYYMVTAADNSVFPERRPKAWTLYGWTTDGERVKLDEVNVNAGGPYDLTTGNLRERMYFIQSAGFQKPMNRFRLEISECFDKDDDATMQIAEFHF